LTDAQKSEAESMYENALDNGVSKEDIYSWYQELNQIKG
jgi:hypothetical protein